MFYYVENCFHWIGFHLVQHLLDAGERVIGFDYLSTPQKNHLSMLVGRHDRFQLKEAAEAVDNDVNDWVYLRVCPGNDEEGSGDGTINLMYGTDDEAYKEKLDLPLLFGLWMPMNEIGMQRENGEWLSLVSDTFFNEAVYIEEYMADLVHCIKANHLSDLDKGYLNEYLANLREVKDNRTIQANLSIVQEHYEHNTLFYPEVNA